MIKQRTPILLILMMLVTPIVSAFDHCSGMDMSNHLLEDKSFSMSTMDASPLTDKEVFKEHQSNKVDMDCHSSHSCTFHVCGGYGIITSSSTIDTNTSLFYSGFETLPPHSYIYLFLFRPPIISL